MGGLKKRVVSGFIWTAGEKFGSMTIKLVTGLFLMDLIPPEQHGVIGLLAPFYLIGITLTDGGFDQALIQRKDISEKDYNSVFYLNIFLSLLLYALLLGFSGVIARFYEAPVLGRLAPWIFAVTPLNALGMVQITKLNREMRFNVLSKIYITSTIVSSATALTMAFTGWGVWSFVGQLLSLHFVRVVMAWGMSSWRPKKEFSMKSVKSLFSYGSNMLFTNLIARFFNNLSQLVVGQISTLSQVGYYDKALKLKEETSNAIQLSIISVTFPAFSALQSEDEKLKFASRKVIAVISLVLFPAMAGLILVSPEVFRMLLPQWLPAVPYFQIFCCSSFFMPLTYICLNIIKAKGASRTVLKLEIIKKAFTLAVIAYTATIGVEAMVGGYVLWVAFEMIVNVIASRRLVPYSLGEMLSDTLPYLGITAAMFLGVMAVGSIWPGMTLGVKLAVKVLAGLLIYLSGNLVIKPQAWQDAIQIVGTLLKRGGDR